LGHLAKLVDSVVVAHALVARAADGPEVVDFGRTALGLGNVVADLINKRRDCIAAPRHEALVIKDMAAPSQPHLLS
jgi:hypothetical protein